MANDTTDISLERGERGAQIGVKNGKARTARGATRSIYLPFPVVEMMSRVPSKDRSNSSPEKIKGYIVERRAMRREKWARKVGARTSGGEQETR